MEDGVGVEHGTGGRAGFLVIMYVPHRFANSRHDGQLIYRLSLYGNERLIMSLQDDLGVVCIIYGRFSCDVGALASGQY